MGTVATKRLRRKERSMSVVNDEMNRLFSLIETRDKRIHALETELVQVKESNRALTAARDTNSNRIVELRTERDALRIQLGLNEDCSG